MAARRAVRAAPKTRYAKVPRTVRRPSKKAVRYAVVGLGYFAQAAILPAFANAPNSHLVALVSDDKVKLKQLGKKYGARHLLSYDEYEVFLEQGLVDAVYIALPNDQHCDFAVKAARAGVHVLTEKPMALTPHECRKMIAAARRHDVRMMVGYRLHFEPGNLAAIETVHSGRIGEPRFFTSTFTMQVKKGNIRTDPKHGGGPLYDIGIYCINAARYLFKAEPITVVADCETGTDARFAGIEEQVSAILTFPGDRLATFTASFGAADIATYTVAGTKGVLTVDRAYEFSAGNQHEVKVGDRTSRRSFPKVDQVAPELIHFSDCVLSGRDPEPSGKEGLIDVEVIHAIQRAIRTGRRQWIGTPVRGIRPTTKQEMRRPAHGVPRLVHAEKPHE
ncbi:MAG TPA: Gfo/Idh/MocA family oxidoreductase [Candidatus Thermoplasmatota archaeon]|nr:Gfo/Idh/MocA family oxidoreductase [Candidatus Thermoplasmatota archaeon]